MGAFEGSVQKKLKMFEYKGIQKDVQNELNNEAQEKELPIEEEHSKRKIEEPTGNVKKKLKIFQLFSVPSWVRAANKKSDPLRGRGRRPLRKRATSGSPAVDRLVVSDRYLSVWALRPQVSHPSGCCRVGNHLVAN